ncbi:MAG: hypothetical protein ABW360_05925, partial [Phenylobacterium sp.]
RPALQDHAVFASLTPADGAAQPIDLRLASAVVVDAKPEAAPAATELAPAEAKPVDAKPAAKPDATPPAGLSKAADTAPKVVKAADASAS